jgi:hypothetical protein
MNGTLSSRAPVVLAALVLLLVAGAVTFSVFAARHLPDGPVALAWDKVACASCSMHVGEPPFAAQLTSKDGRTHAFDDPGCLFLYLAQERPDVHAMWFRHYQQERWLPGHAVAFARVEVTPMGFGLGAVDPGTKDALDFTAASALCLARAEGGHGK